MSPAYQRVSRRDWNEALRRTNDNGMVTLNDHGWVVWYECYGDEPMQRIVGLADHLLEVAFLRAIDLAKDVP